MSNCAHFESIKLVIHQSVPHFLTPIHLSSTQLPTQYLNRDIATQFLLPREAFATTSASAHFSCCALEIHPPPTQVGLLRSNLGGNRILVQISN